MNKDEFWSIDRLLPQIHTSFPPSGENKRGVPLSTMDQVVPEKSFGELIRPSSRVILFYRMTEIAAPEDDLLLQDATAFQYPFVPCSFYAPSFKSLSREQKAYFLYFCHQTENRIKVETSFAYLRLYLCRVLRRSDTSSPLSDLFFWLWETYRADFPLADKLFSDLACDLSLYQGKPFPYDKIGAVFTKKDFTIRPFLMDLYVFDYLFRENHTWTSAEMAFVIRIMTGEYFRKNKAYRSNPTFAAAVEEGIREAFTGGLFNRKDLNDSLFRIQIPSEVHTVRKLFPGLPPGEIPEREINLCYVPLLHDENVRCRYEEIFRYLENRLRAVFGIKNALSRIHIDEKHKSFLDGILIRFQHLAPKKTEQKPAAEKEPVLPRKISVDLDEADKIEEESWGITRRLTEEYAEEGGESVTIGGETAEKLEDRYGAQLEQVERHTAERDSGDFWELAARLTPEEDRFLSLAVHGGAEEARKFSQSLGAFFEAMIASCNQKAQDAVGDGVLDQAGNIFEDYRRELSEVFPEVKGEENEG